MWQHFAGKQIDLSNEDTKPSEISLTTWMRMRAKARAKARKDMFTTNDSGKDDD